MTGFFGGEYGPPGDDDGVVAGRHRWPDPVTGEVRSWTRASNLGAALASHFAMDRARTRRLLEGLGRRPDLLRLLESMSDYGDVGKLDEVAATALEVAGVTAAANEGTAIHEVQRAVDLGLPYPDAMAHHADAYRRELARVGLQVVAVEPRVVNRALGVAGRPDRVYQEVATGRWVIGDTKGTDHLTLAVREFAAQLAAYASAEWLELSGGWSPRPEHLRPDYAVVVHCDRATGAVATYRLDLTQAGYAANLAMQVRAWHNVPPGALLLPYVPDDAGRGWVDQVRDVRTITPFEGQTRTTEDGTDCETWQYRQGKWVLIATERYGPLAAMDLLPRDQNGAMVAPPVVPEGSPAPVQTEQPGPTLVTEAQLLKMPKAAAQQYGRDHGVADIGHNRPQLVKIYREAGILADGPTTPAASAAGLHVRGDDAELPAGPIAGGEDPTDWHTDTYRRARLGEVAAATSVADLGRVWSRVRREGGDAAWTDALAEAARDRAAVLDGQDATADPLQAVLAEVASCTSVEAIGRLWERVTIGGSAPDRWTPVLPAADARLAAIRAATPPAAANPYAPAATP